MQITKNAEQTNEFYKFKAGIKRYIHKNQTYLISSFL